MAKRVCCQACRARTTTREVAGGANNTPGADNALASQAAMSASREPAKQAHKCEQLSIKQETPTRGGMTPIDRERLLRSDSSRSGTREGASDGVCVPILLLSPRQATSRFLVLLLLPLTHRVGGWRESAIERNGSRGMRPPRCGRMSDQTRIQRSMLRVRLTWVARSGAGIQTECSSLGI